MDKDYIVRWQSDLENTKERPLHKPSQDQSKSTALGGLWNFAEWHVTPDSLFASILPQAIHKISENKWDCLKYQTLYGSVLFDRKNGTRRHSDISAVNSGK